MQRNAAGIAILAEDQYEEPELWRILWRALLASADPKGYQVVGSEPSPPGPRATAAKLTTGSNRARDH